MKAIIGVLLIVSGIAFGLWVGLWWAFVGGIIDIVNAVQTSPIPGESIAWGIVKILSSACIGTIAFIVVAGAVYVLVADD